MHLAEFRQVVAEHPDRKIEIVLEDGRTIAPHFHVTEVGRVEKRFVDCGGKHRTTVACVLQTLVASDVEHRLTTTKLSRILALADSLDLPGNAPVELEHQERSVSIDSLARCETTDHLLRLHLAPKHTACLAEDVCGIAPPASQQFDIVGQDACCGPSGCC